MRSIFCLVAALVAIAEAREHALPDEPAATTLELYFAAHLGDETLAVSLIASGAKLNEQIRVVDEDVPKTPLMIAAYACHPVIVHALLTSGADVDAQTSDGWTAIAYAAQSGCEEAAMHILARNARLDLHAIDGGTALSTAAIHGHASVVAALLGTGRLSIADIDESDEANCTALLWAAVGGHHETVRLLLASGASADFVNADGESALLLAAFFGHPEVARVLLQAGADVRLADADGRTPRQRASAKGHATVVRLIDDARQRPAEAEATAAKASTNSGSSGAEGRAEGRAEGESKFWCAAAASLLALLPPLGWWSAHRGAASGARGGKAGRKASGGNKAGSKAARGRAHGERRGAHGVALREEDLTNRQRAERRRLQAEERAAGERAAAEGARAAEERRAEQERAAAEERAAEERAERERAAEATTRRAMAKAAHLDELNSMMEAVQLQRCSATSTSGSDTASSSSDDDESSNGDDTCVICLDAPKDAGIVHDGSVHVCCCLKCARELHRQGQSCPLCRQHIEVVLRTFVS